jgi:hypothetical protein
MSRPFSGSIVCIAIATGRSLLAAQQAPNLSESQPVTDAWLTEAKLFIDRTRRSLFKAIDRLACRDAGKLPGDSFKIFQRTKKPITRDKPIRLITLITDRSKT